MAKKATGFDVGRLAGVSQPTVSRALRNLPGTSPGTRQRVLHAAAELNYLPSEPRSSYSTGGSRTVAVVSAELSNPYYPGLVGPIRRELAARNFETVLISDSDDLSTGIEVLADGSYVGVILTTTLRNSTLPRDLTQQAIPHVLVNRTLDDPESHSCAVDNAWGARAVADLVVGLGHTRIAAIQGPTNTSTGRERAAGLRTGLAPYGVHLRRSMIRRVPFTHDDGMLAADDLLRQHEPPSAIVCGNDLLALGALSAARSRGVLIPDELTVIGFDDIPMAAWPLINLTTVRTELNALAGATVQLLVDQIAAPGRAPIVRRVPVSVILRDTHARCRSG